jgi:UDP-3-O-[3-hydroxymyristoyl] N-acetylglucosamine deacetylase/3-hydroxyacyl-[acyl-carrier-protein] dehydratase
MASEVQHTLARSASITGVALHSGEKVKLTLHPAPPDHGIRFRRADLPDQPVLDASVRNVKSGERATFLAEGSMKVQTCEHVLSALAGLGVDNAIVEMDASEPPIADGSALPYVELIRNAGVEKQEATRRVFEVREPVHVETKSGSLLTVVPFNGFKVSCTQAGPGGRFTQFFSTEITPEIYAAEIAPSRTFVYYEDVAPLMEKGLIRGGSLETALVIKGDAVMGKEPLRFADEFVRHKILDIVGDLALLGVRLRGHVIAVKPGHAANGELCKALAREHARMLAMVPPSVVAKGEGVLDVNDMMKILPHRYPFLMVDRIVAFEGENKCTGVKCVTINEPFFQGHFPGHPVMPGVLQVEAMAQVASVLLLRAIGAEGNIGYFLSADGVKFRKPVLPGDTLFIHVELTKARRNLGKAVCHCTVNNEIVSQGELMFAIVPQ